jgi:hypothetical protein
MATSKLLKAAQRVKILGRTWLLKFVHYPELGLDKLGDCENPDKPGRTIRVLDTLEGAEMFRVLLHEMTHGALWWLDEEFVDTFTKDATAILFDPKIRPRWDH